jgi:signal peptidase I
MSGFYEVSDSARKLKDARIILYEITELVLGVAVVALLVRLFLFQSFLVPASSMENTLQPGDRLFGNRILYGLKVPFTDRVLVSFKPVRPGEAVIYRDPRDNGRYAVRRVVATSGMSVRITAKNAMVNGLPFNFPPTARREESFIIDGKYSPRDNLAEVRLPEKGEEVKLDLLSLPAFDYYASLIRQENPSSRVTVTSDLLKNGQVCSDLKVPDLKADLLKSDSTPDFDAMDWTGLSNILNFLEARDDSSGYSFRRTLYMDGDRVPLYTVKERCFFAIGDNWDQSSDSRYYGFVSERLAVARASFVYWSSEGGHVRWGRLFIFI